VADSKLEDAEKAGSLQQQRIWELAEIKPPKHTLLFLYSPTCPHCAVVAPQLESYVEKHPDVALIKIDATTEENTAFLEAILKGLREVPTVLVDNRFVIKGDVDFLARLTYALQLAENMPRTREEHHRWLLQS